MGLSSIVACFLACFDGAGAKGYPCESDDDCGPSLACASSGCCGGACLFGSEGSTTMIVTSSSTTESTDTSSTTIDPSTSESSESTTIRMDQPVVCGDGEIGGDEACDDGMANGVWKPCQEDCTETLLHFTAQEVGGEDFCVAGSDCDPQWHRLDGDAGPWGSGMYAAEPVRRVLHSKWFAIPASDEAPGLVPQVEIRHELDFNVCVPDVDPIFADGAHVSIQRMDTMVRADLLPEPLDAHSGEIDCDVTDSAYCPSPPPLVFIGTTDEPETSRRATIPMDFAGATVRLVLEVGFDGNDCDPPAGMGGGMPDPWLLQRVIVTMDAPG